IRNGTTPASSRTCRRCTPSANASPTKRRGRNGRPTANSARRARRRRRPANSLPSRRCGCRARLARTRSRLHDGPSQNRARLTAVPILVFVSLALQIACAVHVVRSGRPLYWIWILFIGSYLAVIVYLIVAVIPDLRNDPRSRQAA